MNEREKITKETVEKTIKKVFGEDVDVEIKIIEKEKEKMPNFSSEINKVEKLLEEEKFREIMIASSEALLDTLEIAQKEGNEINPKFLSILLVTVLVAIEKEKVIKIIREEEEND